MNRIRITASALCVLAAVSLSCRTTQTTAQNPSVMSDASAPTKAALPASESYQTVAPSVTALAVDTHTLHRAVETGDASRLERLIAAGADVNARGPAGRTPLHQAVSLAQLDIVRLLLARGADPNAQADDGATPLHYAAWNGHLDIAAILVQNGADVNAKKSDGWTPLRLAEFQKHEDLAAYLRKFATAE